MFSIVIAELWSSQTEVDTAQLYKRAVLEFPKVVFDRWQAEGIGDLRKEAVDGKQGWYL